MSPIKPNIRICECERLGSVVSGQIAVSAGVALAGRMIVVGAGARRDGFSPCLLISPSAIPSGR